MLTNEFFAFMRAREQIRLNRLAGKPREEWTDDPIFVSYKFTNVKREHDHMSRYFLKQYKKLNYFTPEGDWQDREDLFMNCAIARYFGTEKSYEVLGPYTWAGDSRYDEEYFAEIEHYGMQGDLTFTGAYIIPNCGDSRPKYAVVADILRGIHKVHQKIVHELSHPEATRSFRVAMDILTACFGVGSFMGKEIILDYLMATGEEPSDWHTWTPIGPGARRGAARVMHPEGLLIAPLSEPKALRVARDLYEHYTQCVVPGCEHPFWPNDWVTLSLCDIQFQLCEFDKYLRVKVDKGQAKTRFVPRKVG
jgi:hypothetical protein